MNTRRRTLARLMITLACSLVAMELAARWATPAPRIPTGWAAGGGPRFTQHPRRFFALVPHSRSGADHAGAYATSDWAFRGEHPRPRPPGLMRIAVYGESCVYGVGLHGADTLPSSLAQSLADRGLSATQVQVLNLGVPGYSSVQVHTTLDETLDDLAPDVVIFHVGVWNDQDLITPPDDPTRLVLAEAGDWESRLRKASRLVDGALHLLGRPAAHLSHDQVSTGEQAKVRRVSPAALHDRVVSMITRAAASGALVAVLLPSHQPQVIEDWPATAQDAHTVAAAARSAGAHLVLSGQDVLDGTGKPITRYFLDSLHPSPEGAALLGAALAEALEPALRERLARLFPLGETGGEALLTLDHIAPTAPPALGDVRVSFRVSRLDGRPLPPPNEASASLGGSPLLDLVVEPLDNRHLRVEGTLPANADSRPLDLIVRTSAGSAVANGALTLQAPRLSYEPPYLVFSGRPGDACRIQVARARRDELQWTRHGASWLDPDSRQDTRGWLVADQTGTARRALASLQLPPGELLWVQGLVRPGAPQVRGLPNDAMRWTQPCQVPIPP